ncbi:MAG: hypothetical protein WBM86_04875 [Waterburya sp.]
MTPKNWDKSLIDYLKEIPDERDPHGKRHPLWLILLTRLPPWKAEALLKKL